MNNNSLVDTLVYLVHEYGYMTVEDALKISVLQRADLNDPYVFMTKLLKTESLDTIVENQFGRSTKITSEIVDSGTDDDEVFTVVQIGEFYYKITGYESSYGESNWKTWSVVKPKQITKTIYE